MKTEIRQDTGYGLIPKKIMRDKSLSLQAKAIYSYLASFAGNTGKAFPSVSLIRTELGISKDTFYKYMEELKRKGAIKVVQDRSDGKFGKNIYYLNNEVKMSRPKTSDTVKQDTSNWDAKNSDTESWDNISKSIKNNNSINNKDYKQHTSETIKEVMCVLENKITSGECKKILKTANEDIDLIKKKYEIAKVSEYKNLVGFMIKAIQEDWQKPKEQEYKPRGKVDTKFHNFESRTSEYSAEELEHIVLKRNNK